MSQRNPMNERYQNEHVGKSRKSAASAKPKTKAAASVTYSSPKKTPKERKAEQKAQRKEEADRQREIDRKYYTPDTERYKKLRRTWWATLIGAIVCTAASWFLRGAKPEWLAFGCLIVAYVLIILAFYIDFSKIRKERKAYQTRMLALEIEQKKELERKERAEKARLGKGAAKGSQTKGKNMSAAAKRAASSAGAKEDAPSDGKDDADQGETADKPEAPAKKRGFFKRKDNNEKPEGNEQ